MNKMTVEVCVCRQERVFCVAWSILQATQKIHKLHKSENHFCKLYRSESTVFRRFKEHQHRMQNSFRFSAFRKPHQNNKETKKQSSCGLKFACAWLFLSSRNTMDRYLKWNDVLRTRAWWDCAYWETQASLRSASCVLGVWLHMLNKLGAIVLTASRLRRIGRGPCIWGLWF